MAQLAAMKRGPGVPAAFAVLTAGAFLLRALFLYSNTDRDWPWSIFFEGDARHWHLWAVAIVRGEPYDEGLPFHPPLFAWCLAGVYRLLGLPSGSAVPYKLVMAAVNAATVGLAWLWWRRLIGGAWSVVASLIAATSFGWLVLSATYSNEVVYMPLLIATAALAGRGAVRMSWLTAAGLGLVMGLGSLARSEHLSLWPFLIGWLVWRRDREATLAREVPRWVFAMAVSLLVLAPWVARNAAAIDDHNRRHPTLEPISRLAIVSAYGPLNFALANRDSADGGFDPGPLGYSGRLDLTEPLARHLFLHGYAEGWAWIRADPWRFASLATRKLSRWATGLSLGYGLADRPSGLAGTRYPVDLFVPDRRGAGWILAALVAAGAILSLREEWRELSIATLLLAHRAIVTVAFFGYARGMVVLLPFLIPLALLPCVALSRREPRIVQAGVVAAALLAAALTLEATTIVVQGPRDWFATGSIDPATGRLVSSATVSIRPKNGR